MALTVGLGALISAVRASHWDQAAPAERAGFNPVVTSLSGINIAQLAVGVLGVMLFSSEYATGMVRASLTVVPRRLPVLWAKLGIFSAVVGVASLVSTVVAFFLGQSLLHSKGLGVGIGSDHAVRMIIGAAVYVTLVGVIGLALGAVLRNTAAGISSLVALFFVIPPLMDLLPSSWNNTIAPYLPSNAGEAFWGAPDGSHLSPAAGVIVLLAWAAVAIALAAVGLERRDA